MSETEQVRFLTDCFSSIGLPLSERQKKQLLGYDERLVEKNRVMNLTAITEYEDVVIKHFADSAVLFSEKYRETLKSLGLPENPSIIDVGTGAGFPGLVLAIMKPQAKVYLLDALRKRIDFLSELSEELELQNTVVAHGRAEEAVKFSWPWSENGCLREQFDLAVSRAVSDLSVLAEYCLPYVRVGGLFAAYKSGSPDEEISRAGNALDILGGEIAEILRFELPVSKDPRSIILIKKVRETPEKYPRKAGKPEKKPL